MERRENDRDRRSRTIHLTPAAEPLWSKISYIATEVRAELLEGISQDDLAASTRVFERIMVNAEGRF